MSYLVSRVLCFLRAYILISYFWIFTRVSYSRIFSRPTHGALPFQNSPTTLVEFDRNRKTLFDSESSTQTYMFSIVFTLCQIHRENDSWLPIDKVKEQSINSKLVWTIVSLSDNKNKKIKISTALKFFFIQFKRLEEYRRCLRQCKLIVLCYNEYDQNNKFKARCC